MNWLIGCSLKHQRFQTVILRLSLVHCSFKEKMLRNCSNLWICTWFVNTSFDPN